MSPADLGPCPDLEPRAGVGPSATGRPQYDLLVVGGGINGVGIARDAAGRGLRVMLVEQDDLASHTSSWSSKLIHGGLRYLEHYDFRLVRESLLEREVLLRAAPHLVQPLCFVLPHRPEMRSAWLIRVGLWLYDHLGGREKLPGSGRVDLHEPLYRAPLQDWVRTAFYYSDCRVDDSRLVVVNAMDAAARGAVILTRHRCMHARREGTGWTARIADRRSGEQRTVTARALVNACGPWVQHFLNDCLNMGGISRVRLVKGSHIVVPALYDGGHAHILQHGDSRIVFVIPFLDRFSLIGTTDADYRGEPATARISAAEIAYLCEVANRYMRRQIGPADVVWSYAGVRSLYDDARRDPSAVTRDYVFDLDVGSLDPRHFDPNTGRAPLLSVFGGKLTTYRKLAQAALAKLAPYLGMPERPWTATAILPGGDMPGGEFARFLTEFRQRHPWLAEATAHRLVHAHGTLADDMLGGARSLAGLGEDLGGGLTEAELDWLVSREWVQTADDVLWRRSKLGLLTGPETCARIEKLLAKQLPAATTLRD